MNTLRELWHGLWPAFLVAAVGPLVIAERSLGESAPEDLFLLLGVLTVAAGVIVLVVQLLLPRLERSRRVAVGLVIVAALTLPVLLANDRQLLMKENLNSLTTATVASGPNYEAFIVLDSDGTQYTIQRVTEFGKKSVFLDMGTSQFQVFLALKAKGKLSLEQAKSLVKELAFSRGEVQNTVTAARLIDAAQSFPELMAVSQRPWEWR